MSRGLGEIQRLILSSLDESKEWMAQERHGSFCGLSFLRGKYWDHSPKTHDPWLVRVSREIISLDDEEFDLSATLRFLAEKHNRMEKYVHGMQVSPKFQNSFWRAAKRLIQTGYLLRWRDDTNRIVVKGLRFEKMEAKCVGPGHTHLKTERESIN